MTTILRKYHSVARCTLLGEMIEDTAHRYYYRPHLGAELTFVDKGAHAFHFFQLASNSALAWSSVATPLSARSPAACWERKAPRTSSDRRARLFAHTKSSNCRAGRRALRSVTRPSRAHK